MRPEVTQLIALGSLPLEDTWTKDSQQRFADYQRFAEALTRPATDEEAIGLLSIFGPEDADSCYGVAWRLVHFIETAPGWPVTPATSDWGRMLEARLQADSNPWVQFLWKRITNARQHMPRG